MLSRVLFDPGLGAGTSPSRTAPVRREGERPFPRFLEGSREGRRPERERAREGTEESGAPPAPPTFPGRTEREAMNEHALEKADQNREPPSEAPGKTERDAPPRRGSGSEDRERASGPGRGEEASPEGTERSAGAAPGTVPTGPLPPWPAGGEGRGGRPAPGEGAAIRGNGGAALPSPAWIQVRLAPGRREVEGSAPAVQEKAKGAGEGGPPAAPARDGALLKRIFGTVEILLDGGKAGGAHPSGGKALPPAVLEGAAPPAVSAPKAAPPPGQGPASAPPPSPDPGGLAELARRHGIQDLHAHILEELRGKIDPARNEARIRLSPPELGEIKIHLALQDHRLTLRMEVQEHGVRHLLARDLGQLRQALAEAGLEVDHLDIQARGERRWGAYRGRPRGEGSARGGGRKEEAVERIAPPPASRVNGPLPAAPGRVDYLVY